MSALSITAIILAAGRGTRMKSDLPKVMHNLAGRPMIQHLVATLGSININNICAVVSPSMDDVCQAVSPHSTAIQAEARGTGHAVLSAKATLGSIDGTVLVLFGADPLVSAETISKMIARREADDNPAVVVLGFRPGDAGLYGRLVTNQSGDLEAIVEAKEATTEQLTIPLCNSGVMAIDGSLIWSLLERVTDNNAKGEYYLTDIIELARADGHTCALVEGDANELVGVDSRADLAQAEALIQTSLRQHAMDNGATLTAPETVFFSFDTQLGQDVIVQPNVVFGPGVSVDDGVTIKSFSHLEGCHVSNNAIIGPYARLRPGAELAEGVRIGNFVEIKNATLGAGAKVNHLSYIGDSSVGARTNIGAGTITCNYDGFNKHRTEIGEGAFIGSNTAIVSPVRIGDGAIIGAGSTISKSVENDALAVVRADQRSIKGWAAKFRQRHQKK